MLRIPHEKRSHQNLLTTVSQQGLGHLLSPNLPSINSAGLSQLRTPNLCKSLDLSPTTKPQPSPHQGPSILVDRDHLQLEPHPQLSGCSLQGLTLCRPRGSLIPISHDSHSWAPDPSHPGPTGTCRAGLSDSRFRTFFLCSLRRPSIFRMGGKYSSSARSGGGFRGSEAPWRTGRGWGRAGVPEPSSPGLGSPCVSSRAWIMSGSRAVLTNIST